MVDEDPAAMVVDAGTVAAAFELDKPTAAPPKGAGPDSVTVQMLDAPPRTVAGAH